MTNAEIIKAINSELRLVRKLTERVDGLVAQLELRREPDFMERLRSHLDEDRRLMNKLAAQDIAAVWEKMDASFDDAPPLTSSEVSGGPQ